MWPCRGRPGARRAGGRFRCEGRMSGRFDAGLGEDVPLPPGSDVDVCLALTDGAFTSDRGKRFGHVDGFFVDVAYVPGVALRSSERILRDCCVHTHSPDRSVVRPRRAPGRGARRRRGGGRGRRVGAARGGCLRTAAPEPARRADRVAVRAAARPSAVYPLPVVAHLVLTAGLTVPVVWTCCGELRGTLLRRREAVRVDSGGRGIFGASGTTR